MPQAPIVFTNLQKMAIFLEFIKELEYIESVEILDNSAPILQEEETEKEDKNEDDQNTLIFYTLEAL